ncbi:MAG: peptide deformylase [Gammaproteobacteria bacterium]|nr:peptide deformylase [Gammaproteobacteria bacterium]MDD9800076.1 peptide deformylase [Gammaproteobacteria bacterium]MDD9815760.1 peptide deformylase [Gammaproteobacteria bacterium]MDD9851016.1 peptide deformylase [Gammaproteobacteria bacterium]MDD9870412.1 peptide deformylase [Gammaproteobacteria bacterium]
MALLHIRIHPDPCLRVAASAVGEVDAEVRRLVDDMAETMYAAPGIGLAAVQVDVPLRVAVVDVSEERDRLLVLINPEIVSAAGSVQAEEGCLSLPGLFAEVTRRETLHVRAINRAGEKFELHADGLLAVCIQHEIDHLNGKLFTDRLSRLKRERILDKWHKERAAARVPGGGEAHGEAGNGDSGRDGKTL